MKKIVLSICMLVGCGESTVVQDGSVPSPDSELVALYDVCGARDTCAVGECISIFALRATICTTSCSGEGDCADNSEGEVMCAGTLCQPYRCDEDTPDNTVLGNELICIDGVQRSCGEGQERHCACGCGAGFMCEPDGVGCVSKLGLGELCENSNDCASSHCATPQSGGQGVCKLLADAPCSEDSDDCDGICNVSPDGNEGYCLNECDRYCGDDGCYDGCEAGYVCDGVFCFVRCTEDDDCRAWEVCSGATDDGPGSCATAAEPGSGADGG